MSLYVEHSPYYNDEWVRRELAQAKAELAALRKHVGMPEPEPPPRARTLTASELLKSVYALNTASPEFGDNHE